MEDTSGRLLVPPTDTIGLARPWYYIAVHWRALGRIYFTAAHLVLHRSGSHRADPTNQNPSQYIESQKGQNPLRDQLVVTYLIGRVAHI